MDLSNVFHAFVKARDQSDRSAIYQQRELEFLSFVSRNLVLSNAQLFQDLWVLFELGEKRGGYFVEFGACDGVRVSNTLLLEKHFGWNGILAEPARGWHEDLVRNRSCFISKRCVYRSSNDTLQFHETDIQELSTIESFTESDFQSVNRHGSNKYAVETISLHDLLMLAKAPRTIDYMSMDTEGSELEIMTSFNFGEYDIGLISVEHNFSDARGRIFDHLTSCGYRRVLPGLSAWDDWYAKIRT